MDSPRGFHAVAIVCGTNSCAASSTIEGVRYFPDDAPRLPIEECSKPAECACVYRHYLDRRAPPAKSEAHTNAGRRALDKTRKQLAKPPAPD